MIKLVKDDKIYYVSHEDGCIHNINDIEHFIDDNGESSYACIGVDLGEELFRVDQEVDLHTIEDILNLFKYNNFPRKDGLTDARLIIEDEDLY